MFILFLPCHFHTYYVQTVCADSNCSVTVRVGCGLISQVIDDILDENACENFGNEARWMDLRRTQTLVTRCTKYNHEMGDKAAQYIGKKLLRPIPQAAIDANDQLTLADQNPGY